MTNCKYCQTETSNPIYCSRSCSASSLNSLFPKRVGVVKNCPVCAKAFTSKYATFCDRACYLKSKRTHYDILLQEKTERYLSGDHSECTNKDGQTQRWFARYIKSQGDGKCERCGWAEANPLNGMVYLEMDHIDGDCFNSNRENLRILCPNCHSLTPTYKSLNSGHSRRTATYGKRASLA